MSGLGGRALRKAFGRNEVLRSVDLDVRGGEVCFLLGVNGAGKSTLLGALAGEVALDGGAVHVGGDGARVDLAAAPDRARAAIAFVPQKPPLAGLLSPREHLDTMMALRALPATARPRFDDAIAALGITRFVDEPCRTLSGGTQQKVALSLAYAVAAEVLLLDEPWTGLDILSARALRGLLEAERARGAALLTASHLPETALALADRAVVLAAGRIVTAFDADALAAFGGDPRAFEAAIVEAMALEADRL